jgi:hypothetical protein
LRRRSGRDTGIGLHKKRRRRPIGWLKRGDWLHKKRRQVDYLRRLGWLRRGDEGGLLEETGWIKRGDADYFRRRSAQLEETKCIT